MVALVVPKHLCVLRIHIKIRFSGILQSDAASAPAAKTGSEQEVANLVMR